MILDLRTSSVWVNADLSKRVHVFAKCECHEAVVDADCQGNDVPGIKEFSAQVLLSYFCRECCMLLYSFMLLNNFRDLASRNILVSSVSQVNNSIF